MLLDSLATSSGALSLSLTTCGPCSDLLGVGCTFLRAQPRDQLPPYPFHIFCHLLPGVWAGWGGWSHRVGWLSCTCIGRGLRLAATCWPALATCFQNFVAHQVELFDELRFVEVGLVESELRIVELGFELRDTFLQRGDLRRVRDNLRAGCCCRVIRRGQLVDQARSAVAVRCEQMRLSGDVTLGGAGEPVELACGRLS